MRYAARTRHIKKHLKTQALQETDQFEQFLHEGTGVSDPQDMLGISGEQLMTIFDEATQYLMLHDTQHAIRSFQLLCILCPYDADCWIGLGRAYREEGSYAQALSNFLMAETVNRSNSWAYEEAIETCIEMKAYEEARHILERYKKHRKACERELGGESLLGHIIQYTQELQKQHYSK